MKSFYIEDWLLENGANPLFVILFVLLGIAVPLIAIRLWQAKKHRDNDRKKGD